MNQDKADDRNCNLRYMSQSANIRRSIRLNGPRKQGPHPFYSAAIHELERELWATGRWSQVKISRAIGVKNSSVSFIVNNKKQPRKGAKFTPPVDWAMLGADPAEFAY